MSDTSVETVSKTRTQLREPGLYDVVFYNDQKTHYDFVVLILMHLFGKEYNEAVDLTNLIHERGKSAVATYAYEIAATKRDEVTSTARANGHPLRVEIEPHSTQG
jgi:ATP-dependent Clp protease adaptor protein ClpS